MSTKNRESSSSDDGYNSDQQTRQRQKYNIARDTATFKKNYHVQELIKNSANGVIYSGLTIDQKTKSHCFELTISFNFLFRTSKLMSF